MCHFRYRACLFGPIFAAVTVDAACRAGHCDVGAPDSELIERCGNMEQGVERSSCPRMLQVKAENMAAAQVFEELKVSRRRNQAAALGMRDARATRRQLHMNISTAAAAAAAAALHHADLVLSTQLLPVTSPFSTVGSRMNFGFSNLFEQLDDSRSSRSRWAINPAGLTTAVLLIVVALLAAYACVFHRWDDDINPTSGMHLPQQQQQQQQQQHPTLRQPEISRSISSVSKRSSPPSGVLASSVSHTPQEPLGAWTLAQAETPEMHRGGITGSAGVSHARRLCKELLVPQHCESSLLMPKPFPPVGELQGRILIEDVTLTPIFHATYYLHPRQGMHSDSLQCGKQPTRLMLTATADDFVYASCVDAHIAATSQSGLGLLLQDEKGRDFGMLTPNGRSEKSGFVLKTHTELQVSLAGDLTVGKLNCTDQLGVLLASTDPHGQHQRVIRIGPGVDVGLIMLCLLGVELLRHDLRSTSTPM